MTRWVLNQIPERRTKFIQYSEYESPPFSSDSEQETSSEKPRIRRARTKIPVVQSNYSLRAKKAIVLPAKKVRKKNKYVIFQKFLSIFPLISDHTVIILCIIISNSHHDSF